MFKNTWHDGGGTEQRLELRPSECSKKFFSDRVHACGGNCVVACFLLVVAMTAALRLHQYAGGLCTLSSLLPPFCNFMTSLVPLASTRRETTKSDPPYCHSLRPLLLSGAQIPFAGGIINRQRFLPRVLSECAPMHGGYTVSVPVASPRRGGMDA